MVGRVAETNAFQVVLWVMMDDDVEIELAPHVLGAAQKFLGICCTPYGEMTLVSYCPIVVSCARGTPALRFQLGHGPFPIMWQMLKPMHFFSAVPPP